MSPLDDIAERLSPPRIVALGAVGAALPVLATLFTTGIVDVILVCVAGIAALSGGAVWQRRRRIDALPLEIGRHAVRDEVDGRPVVRFRARLGRGRRAEEVKASVRFVGPDGHEHTLPVAIPAPEVCGPWTVTAADSAGHTAGPGVLEVRVEVREGGRRWSADARFTSVQAGRFVPPAFRAGRSLRLERDRWDVVLDAPGPGAADAP